MRNKKGELTSQQIITIVLLIVSFIVLLGFLLLLNIGGTIDEESCRNSVMMRQIPFGNKVIDLKCKTENVCLSIGEKCTAYSKDIETVNLIEKSQIVKEISDRMAKCWWMMGEGKVDYGSDGDCAICYKIAFDNKVTENIPYTDVYNFMSRNMPGEEITYLFYLYQVRNVMAAQKQVLSATDNKLDIGNEKIDVKNEYVIVTKVSSKGDLAPVFVKFGAEELKSKVGCTGFVTEV